MEIAKLKQLVTEKLERSDRSVSYDRKEQVLRIENQKNKKGVSLALRPLLAKYETKKEAALEEAIRYVNHALEAMGQDITLAGKEKQIFPVIRSTSFPETTKDGKQLIFAEHTSETRIYYSVDLGHSYVLLDEEMINNANITKNDIMEMAQFNMRSLPIELKEDIVAGNSFYFVSTKDGYDASRILNEAFLAKMQLDMKGKMAVAVPHQDVCIIADLVNDTGYDVLGQMTFQFFNQGNNPITALPFLYENGELEPTFILAQRKPKKD
ncbi:DUF1444 family protein [Alkalihalobacterium bogoriense]|uniref:DUF1444 family protein n=1 Tax=Alkalihalobacterium bogoriense TaxID=246272 RepID=UPI00047C3E96|nr:DUF1444 family protein [Alkalihalobacterium bogoriense]